MRRLVVLLALSGALYQAFALAGCGGNDKPPLTPDAVDTTIPGDTPEAGPPPAHSAK